MIFDVVQWMNQLVGEFRKSVIVRNNGIKESDLNTRTLRD